MSPFAKPLWSFDGQILDIFGTQGCKQGGRNYFGYNRTLVEHRHHSVISPIVSHINEFITRKGFDAISRITISEIEALQLYFENVLTIGALESAELEPDRMMITVKLPIVRVMREVSIHPQPHKTMIGYYDVAGNPVHYA